MKSLFRTACSLLMLVSFAWAGAPIHTEPLPLEGASGVQLKPVMTGEINEVKVDLVSLANQDRHLEPAHERAAIVWLVLDGRGTMRTRGLSFEVDGETVARAPQGWDWHIEPAPGSALHLVRIKRDLTDGDLVELKRFPEFQAAPLVKKFRECTPYHEAIKSAKTVSRTLLPENHVPRMAIGTVETTGPDEVGAHRHPMLEQLFVGLRGNDITVTADDEQINLKEFTILHIPLGSNHGAKVEAGRKLHYIWVDFFMAKEGQEWLKMHKPVEETKR
jgi:quercetin dioxygenase-like cupin family protein